MEGLPFNGVTGERLRKALLVTVILLAVFLAAQTVSAFMGWRYIGTGITPTNTISVSGHGEAYGVPDIATFTFSIVSDKTTVADAQSDATTKANAITDYLKSAGIDAKDIQTTDYSVQPQYDYQTAVCPQATVAPTTMMATANGSSGTVSASAIYCPGGKQVLKGYEVRQTTTIKVRDTSKAGDLLSAVGTKGATEVSGLTFTFDNPTQVQDQAREKAIADAKTRADALAKQLGVSLVRVVSFNENQGGNPRPVYYSMAAGAAKDVAATAPEISTGQNQVTDDVTVTYEIR